MPREKSEVQNLLPDTITEEEKERIYGILGQAVCRPAGIQARKTGYSGSGGVVPRFLLQLTVFEGIGYFIK